MKKTSRIIFALLLTMIMIISMSTIAFADTIILSGNCGRNGASNAKFKLIKIDNYEEINNCYDRERIVISGTGEMADYTIYTSGRTTSPWTNYVWDFTSIFVEEGITRIGNYAFCDMDYYVCRVSLPSTLESIGDCAFSGSLDYVKELTIPNSVKLLGKAAFSNIGVETVTIPGSIPYIPEQAFSFCDNLKSVVMLEGVTRIGPDAFWRNGKLESVTIPASVTQIDQSAFSICDNLKTIYYKGTPEQWEEITIAAGNDDLLNATVNFPKIAVESVSLDKATKTLFVGNTFTLTATVMPENAYDKSVNWKSSNTSVATVSDGVVTAKAPGTAKITATTVDGAKVASCTVSVQQAPNVAVTGISLNKSYTNLSVGETETLIATVSPSNATNMNVTWSSSNTNVATVTNGVVTAKSAGEATITVKTEDGSKSAICTVIINTPVIPDVPTNDAKANIYTEAPKSAVQGSSFSYKIYLEGTYDGYAFELPVQDGFTITEVVAADGVDTTDIDGKWLISVIGGLEKTEAPKELVVTVTVSVAKDAELGDREISLDEIMVTTDTGDAVGILESYFATINITDQLPGDINSDGKFNYLDVSKLYALFRNKTTVPEHIITDINDDGKFNYLDVSKLYAIFRGKAAFN